ncbi:MAG TPA: dipeptidase [Stackebrandtia sp.]|jgi:membrane dipeptidase|uniref:dipeptidase n=1 Tax=Stackebrandtia sp. TaxID=2023065 RepID=UPI002D390C4B|nr:dipeptidase [Stackebrandtia sp.]HZE40353.1 dipeptidase [Stackebrandtia sp.]
MSTLLSSRVADLLAAHPVIDGHNDLLIRMRRLGHYDFDAHEISADRTADGLHTDIPRIRRGGLGGQFWSVFVPVSLAGESAVTATLEQIDAAREMIDRYGDFRLALTADDIEASLEAGTVASLLGAEGGHSIGCSLGTLRMMYALGVRYMTLTHTDNTPWADSATDDPKVGGLSAFGREVVREMNRLGMLVDISHVAATTMHAALDVSEAPAFFSHSNTLELCGHPRNVPDDVLRRVGETHGVVMATFVPGFLTDACREWVDAYHEFQGISLGDYDSEQRPESEVAQWKADHPHPGATASDVADHIERIRDLAGVDCVGIGGDLDGIGTTPTDIPDVTGYPVVLEELASRGWSDDDLAKLTCRNVIRVLRDTENVAARARAQRGPSRQTFAELDQSS